MSSTQRSAPGGTPDSRWPSLLCWLTVALEGFDLAEVRNTALGLAASVGRLGAIVGPLVTGSLVASGLAYPFGFYFFAAVAVLGLVAMPAVPHERALRRTEEVEREEVPR